MPNRPVKTVILTLGNELRGDDNAGLLFGSLVRDRISARVIEGGDAPENVTGLVAAMEPEEILIVDAMEMGGGPGDCIVVDGAEINADAASTHGTSRMLVEYLTASTGASVRFLGFQPVLHGIGDGMSPEVEERVRETADLFVSAGSVSDALEQIGRSRRQDHDRKA